MGLCMADVMPRMQTRLCRQQTPLCCARIQSAVSTARQSLRQDQQDLSARVCRWVDRPPNPVNPVDLTLGVPTWSLIRTLVVFRIPAWNLFLEIGEARGAAEIHI